LGLCDLDFGPSVLLALYWRPCGHEEGVAQHRGQKEACLEVEREMGASQAEKACWEKAAVHYADVVAHSHVARCEQVPCDG
jgi:hypothetical protein